MEHGGLHLDYPKPYPATVQSIYNSRKFNIATGDNSAWSRGWDEVDNFALREALNYYGCGRWSAIKGTNILPGKKTTQIYLQTQRILGQQALKGFTGMQLNLEKTRKWNDERIESGKMKSKHGIVHNSNDANTHKREKQYAEEHLVLTNEEKMNINFSKMFAPKQRVFQKVQDKKDQILQGFREANFISTVVPPSRHKKKHAEAHAELKKMRGGYSMDSEAIRKELVRRVIHNKLKMLQKIEKKMKRVTKKILEADGIEGAEDGPLSILSHPAPEKLHMPFTWKMSTLEEDDVVRLEVAQKQQTRPRRKKRKIDTSLVKDESSSEEESAKEDEEDEEDEEDDDQQMKKEKEPGSTASGEEYQ